MVNNGLERSQRSNDVVMDTTMYACRRQVSYTTQGDEPWAAEKHACKQGAGAPGPAPTFKSKRKRRFPGQESKMQSAERRLKWARQNGMSQAGG